MSANPSYLLIEFPIGGVTQRISDRILNLEHPYTPDVIGFTPIAWRCDSEHGGLVRMGGGDITITARLFRDLGVWPPPVQATPTVRVTQSTEAAAVTLFTHAAHLVDYNREQAVYDLREHEYNEQLLNETIDYDGNDVALPLAVGPVTHRTPIRLADDDSGRPRYHLAGLDTSAVALQIVAFSSVSGGAATRVTTAGAHGYSNGETAYISGSDNFDGGHVINDAAGTSFTIPVAFAQETLPINAQCYQAGGFCAHDDGVPIPENVVINGDGTMSLSASPVGQVTISGTPDKTTLDDWADWCHTRLGITTYTNTYARSPSPELSKWITAQQTVVDFLSGICRWSTHLCYIDESTDEMILVDCYKDNGSRALTDFDFYEKAEYKKPNPLKHITSTWQTYSAAIGWVNDDHSGGQSHFIKTTPHEIRENLYGYGDEKSIEACHETEANVRSALVCIRSVYELDRATIRIPLSATRPVPGEKISWTDSTVPVDTPGYIRARDIDFDHINHEYVVTGDGVFIRTDRAADTGSQSVSGAATETIDSIDMTLGKGAVWLYVIDDGSRTNMRTGEIQAVWDQAAGGNVAAMPEEASEDIGITHGVVRFSVDKAAITVRLRATSQSGNWNIYTVRTVIGASY